jgi:hypothetical protein
MINNIKNKILVAKNNWKQWWLCWKLFKVCPSGFHEHALTSVHAHETLMSMLIELAWGLHAYNHSGKICIPWTIACNTNYKSVNCRLDSNLEICNSKLTLFPLCVVWGIFRWKPMPSDQRWEKYQSFSSNTTKWDGMGRKIYAILHWASIIFHVRLTRMSSLYFQKAGCIHWNLVMEVFIQRFYHVSQYRIVPPYKAFILS